MEFLASDISEIIWSRIEHYKEKFGNGYINIFSISIDSATELEQKWELVRNLVAVRFQSKNRNDFDKWNTYLFFVLKERISKDLKYKIENDIFSSRKIVVDGQKLSNEKIIEKYIKNPDIKTVVGDDSSTINFKKNETIERIIGEGKLKEKKVDREVVGKALDKLIEELIGDNNEI